jgi:peptidoglycan hydrolase CwlO-like protein
MNRKYLPWAGFALMVAVAIVAVGVFDYSALAHMAHADSISGFIADAAGLATLEKSVGDLAVQLKEAADDVKKSAETTQTELKNLGKTTEETKKSADDALIKHNEIAARMTELEQKMTQLKQGGGPERAKSLGER